MEEGRGGAQGKTHAHEHQVRVHVLQKGRTASTPEISVIQITRSNFCVNSSNYIDA